MPKLIIWAWVTVSFSFAGMLTLGGSVVIEMLENHCAKEDLVLETAEFPDVLSSALEKRKKQVRSEHDTSNIAHRDAA